VNLLAAPSQSASLLPLSVLFARPYASCLRPFCISSREMVGRAGIPPTTAEGAYFVRDHPDAGHLTPQREGRAGLAAHPLSLVARLYLPPHEFQNHANPRRLSFPGEWYYVILVGMRGFEPPASSSRTTRATKLRHIPIERGLNFGFGLQDLSPLSHPDTPAAHGCQQLVRPRRIASPVATARTPNRSSWWQG
jgi:hypothetical protein